MILLDTHVWFWWVQGETRLNETHAQSLTKNAGNLAASVFSCWEIAKLVSAGKIVLSVPLEEWIEQALVPSGVRLLPLTPRIAIESTQLPGDFHRDPADQIIVATARIHDCELLTVDTKILSYPHVKTLK